MFGFATNLRESGSQIPKYYWLILITRPQFHSPSIIYFNFRAYFTKPYMRFNSELKQVTFLTTQTSTGSKIDVFHQSQPLTQSSDVTHAVRVVKNVTCLSSLICTADGHVKIACRGTSKGENIYTKILWLWLWYLKVFKNSVLVSLLPRHLVVLTSESR